MAPARVYDPQKALLVDRPPTGDRWLHELKLDGFRMGVVIAGKRVRIISRRGTEYTDAYPEIVAAARALKVKDAVLDGEVVVLDAQGVSRFQLLQQLAQDRHGLAFFAFDLLSLNGENLRPLPLVERKRRLRRLLGTRKGMLRYTAHMDLPGAEVFDNACALGAEGIISKRRDAPYRDGARSPDWQKIKCVKRQELVVGGFTDPKGSRVGIGSLLVGYYEGDALRFAGKVGTGRGWNEELGRTLRRRLERSEVARPPFDPPPRGWLGKHAHWVTPKLVAEVEFSEWTADGRVRHPSLQGFRKDKRPREVVREREVSAAKAAESPVVLPALDLTLDDVAAIYAEIMDWALPHVEGRPLTLVRMREPLTKPDALRSQARFVHHTAREQKFVGDAVPRVAIQELRKVGEYRYVDSPEALLALIRAGVVEWHVWNARVGDVERPDRAVFDIDPGRGVSWAGVVDAARRVRKALARRDLESWVKTTGGAGVHVVVPFRPEHDWDAVFRLRRAIAAEIEADKSRVKAERDRLAAKKRSATWKK